MENRDGFPTNRELVTVLEHKGAELFTSAFVQDFVPNLHPGYQGKPIDLLRLNIVQTPSFEDIRHQLRNFSPTEVLQIGPCSDESDIEFHHYWRKHPEIVAHRLNIAQKVGNLVFSSDMESLKHLEPEAILTSYNMKNSINKYIDTRSDKLKKMLLLGGALPVVEEAMEYVDSTAYLLKKISTHPDNYAFDVPQARFGMSHYWSLDIRSDIPLNGNEPYNFLCQVMRKMTDLIDKRKRRMEELKPLDAPSAIINKEKELIEQAQETYNSANSYLR